MLGLMILVSWLETISFTLGSAPRIDNLVGSALGCGVVKWIKSRKGLKFI